MLTFLVTSAMLEAGLLGDRRHDGDLDSSVRPSAGTAGAAGAAAAAAGFGASGFERILPISIVRR